MAGLELVAHQDQRLSAFFKSCAKAAWAEPLWLAVVNYFLESGFARISYLHLPPLGAPDEGKVRVSAHGFPEAWILQYIREKLYREDPLLATANSTEIPFHWQDIWDLRTLTETEKAFMARLAAAGLDDGIAVPVFGPNGRNGYFGLGYDGPRPDAPSMYRCQAVGQTAHLRYCHLRRNQLPAIQPLSEREVELLHWVVRGKSNGVIADIMDISPHTVDAYLRRVFLKLGTSNRISAAIQALGSGLIRGY